MRQVSASAQPLLWTASQPRRRETIIFWPLSFAMAVRPVIFLPRSACQWDPVTRHAVLAHERVHHRQQRRLGLPRFALAYYLSRRLRWRIERAGYRREFAVYLKHGGRPIAENYAPMLSGLFYSGMVGYSDALAWCETTLRRLDHV